MKIEIDFNDLSDVIYTLYSYEMYRERDLNTREGVIAAIAEINETLAEDGDGKIQLVEEETDMGKIL